MALPAGVSTSGNGTVADPYISTWTSNSVTHSIRTSSDTLPQETVRESHHDAVIRAIADYPVD